MALPGSHNVAGSPGGPRSPARVRRAVLRVALVCVPLLLRGSGPAGDAFLAAAGRVSADARRRPVWGVLSSLFGSLHEPLRRLSSRSALGEEEDDKPGVRFLPPMDFGQEEELEPAEDAQVMPCFPLGAVAYVPDTKPVLNIFEPRYRQMYSDILFSGGRRFVVPQITQDEESGTVRLSEVGVVFYLSDLKEVSEQTSDRIKYQCEHEVRP
eukprot:TRINITY_DN12547_c0_g2_i1.p1 TRINITY_DN12547_c0_g2~~TRINITY_DN12547_c0_g2_i1.p1  ORF type:complete len:235 (-),score=11.71 TRINITY_DN12547_c0_g2_i1:79-711(-)